MSHPWESLVLGGVDSPRFLLVDNNYVTNEYFNIDTSGWFDSGAETEKYGDVGVLTRVEDDDAYSQYMGKINYSNDLQNVNWLYSYGSLIENKMFVAKFRYKSDYNFKVELHGASSFVSKTFSATSKLKQGLIIGTAVGETTTFVTLKIFGSENSGDANLYFDHVYFSEVLSDYIFNQPNETYLVYEIDTIGSNRKWNGQKQLFNKKYIPNYFGNFKFIGSGWEIWRQKISLATNIICLPHKDNEWGFLCIWDEDLERRYFMDRFFGHTGKISLSGSEYIYELPSDQAGDGGLYVSGKEIVY